LLFPQTRISMQILFLVCEEHIHAVCLVFQVPSPNSTDIVAPVRCLEQQSARPSSGPKMARTRNTLDNKLYFTICPIGAIFFSIPALMITVLSETKLTRFLMVVFMVVLVFWTDYCRPFVEDRRDELQKTSHRAIGERVSKHGLHERPASETPMLDGSFDDYDLCETQDEESVFECDVCKVWVWLRSMEEKRDMRDGPAWQRPIKEMEEALEREWYRGAAWAAHIERRIQRIERKAL
jgi:hypothetical protein